MKAGPAGLSGLRTIKRCPYSSKSAQQHVHCSSRNHRLPRCQLRGLLRDVWLLVSTLPAMVPCRVSGIRPVQTQHVSQGSFLAEATLPDNTAGTPPPRPWSSLGLEEPGRDQRPAGRAFSSNCLGSTEHKNETTTCCFLCWQTDT